MRKHNEHWSGIVLLPFRMQPKKGRLHLTFLKTSSANNRMLKITVAPIRTNTISALKIRCWDNRWNGWWATIVINLNHFIKIVEWKIGFWLQAVNLSVSKINYVQSRNVMKSLWKSGLVEMNVMCIGNYRMLWSMMHRRIWEGVFCFGYITIVFIVGKTAIIPPHLSSCFK